jgi:hypothetical protein
MGTTTVAYGMTESLYRHEDYIPMMDGWRRLRDGSMPAQNMIHFQVPDALLLGLTKETVAEMLYVATNAPEEAIPPYGPLAVWFAEALRDKDAARETWRSLSVGDTVTVWGQASVACQRTGWKEIA